MCVHCKNNAFAGSSLVCWKNVMPQPDIYHFFLNARIRIFAGIKRFKTMKKQLFLALFSTLLSSLPAFALQFQSGDNVRISQPVAEDIYVFGGTIYIEAKVTGDVYCAGGTVTVSDTVTGDLVAGGGNIYLRGAVLDDVRAAGGTMTISGDISGDLLITGGTVTVEPGVIIGGDMAVSGGTVNLNGTVQGNLKSASGTFTLNGMVEKTAELNGGQITLNGVIGGTSVFAAERITLGEKASLRGNVRYWSGAGEINFGNALQGGATATFDPTLREHFERPDYKFLGFASFLAVLWYLLASFILIWLGQWLFHKVFSNAAVTARAEPVRSLGYGFLYFVAVPVAVVLLFITVIGIPVGLIALTFYVMFLLLANVITALVGAHFLDRWKGYNWRPIRIVLVALGLLVLLKILGFIPFVGWIVKIAAVLIAFGAILDNTGILRRKQASV